MQIKTHFNYLIQKDQQLIAGLFVLKAFKILVLLKKFTFKILAA